MITVMRLAILLSAALLSGFEARGESLELLAPQRLVQDMSDRFQAYLSREGAGIVGDRARIHRLVDELLLPHVDFSRVSRLALGPGWSEASELQRRAFSAAFKNLLVGTYADLFHEYKRWEIRHLPMRMTGEERDVRVRTEIQFPGAKPIEVVYRMALTDLGWQRSQFVIPEVLLQLDPSVE